MNRKKQRSRGFTIIEMLVVVFIIVMLATLIAPRIFKGLGKTRRDIARTKMSLIENALEEFHLACGRYPDESEGLEILASATAPEGLEEKYTGPHLKRTHLLDPWDNPYVFVPEGTVNEGSYDIISYGADGEQGGEGEDADIYNE